MTLSKRVFLFVAVTVALLNYSKLYAGAVEVVKVTAHCQAGSCRFDVTLLHQDEGWEHYANEWQVQTLDGDVLGTRTLFHPHVNEQPFTRSLAGVEIPNGLKQVKIIANDSVHGHGEPKVVTLNWR
ncbi:MAG: hypothetical protein OQK12_09695 [Motiliproteus sp.]|nr:hypothetical protein [Motiliproteus sp.]MCW9053443.1 hypothetical protein [Motiliproteus sp.]